jgi:hypothetical protein
MYRDVDFAEKLRTAKLGPSVRGHLKLETVSDSRGYSDPAM